MFATMTNTTRVPQPGALRTAAAVRHVRRDRLREPAPPAAARRNRKVRARDVLLQRRARSSVRRRRPRSDSLGPFGSRRTISRPRCARSEITEAALEDVARADTTTSIVMNYANADMVGHTGMWADDRGSSRRLDVAWAGSIASPPSAGGILAITADHGNAEEKLDAERQRPDAHTTNPVPFVLITDDLRHARNRRTARRHRDHAAFHHRADDPRRMTERTFHAGVAARSKISEESQAPLRSYQHSVRW